ncbi:hypothetical protein [Alcanivorax sp. 1008]|uniref:hypothetical protein n=1 Tax=Alcanivorax sp. 1008 TaxID=2816853 RepID=UPI001D7183AD|nr:hypothetical protein [Alcanivorax sp. 1008]MCC1496733.1 hypothetical protein [Alcanivorax sp. 1008]
MTTFLDGEKDFLRSVDVGPEANEALSGRISELESILADQQAAKVDCERTLAAAQNAASELNRIIARLGGEQDGWGGKTSLGSPFEMATSLCFYHSRLLSAAFLEHVAARHSQGPHAAKPMSVSLAREHNQHILALLIHAGMAFQIDEAIRSVRSAAGVSDMDFSRGSDRQGSDNDAPINLAAFDVLFGQFPFPEIFENAYPGWFFLSQYTYPTESRLKHQQRTLFGTLLACATSYINGRQRLYRSKERDSYPTDVRRASYADLIEDIPLFKTCLKHVQDNITYSDSSSVTVHHSMSGSYYPLPYEEALAGFEDKVNAFVSTALQKHDLYMPAAAWENEEESAWYKALTFVSGTLTIPS